MDPLAGRFVLDDASNAVGDPQHDAAERLALLGAVGDGHASPTVRLRCPAPTAAFSRRDALLAGYPAAVEAARAHCFEPVVRPVGGRMAPYHRGCLVVDIAGRADDPATGTTARFAHVADLIVAALGRLGVEARVGPVPHEYCPGEHSVNIGGTTKVAGTAQRLRRRTYLVSAVVVVTDAAPLRAVTVDVYQALGLELDPSTVGCIADHAPGVTVPDVRDALVASLSTRLAR